MVNSIKILIGAGPSFAWGFSGSDRQYMNNNLAVEYDAFENFFKNSTQALFARLHAGKKH